MKRYINKCLILVVAFVIVASLIFMAVHKEEPLLYSCKVDFTYSYRRDADNLANHDSWLVKIARERAEELVGIWNSCSFKSNIANRCVRDLTIANNDAFAMEQIISDMRIVILENPVTNFESQCRLLLPGKSKDALTAVASICMDMFSASIADANAVSVYKASYVEQQKRGKLARRMEQLESMVDKGCCESDTRGELDEIRKSIKELDKRIYTISNTVMKIRAERITNIDISTACGE